MTDQFKWLGKKQEVEFAEINFSGKLAGKSWQYQQQVDGLIRTRVFIFLMSILVFYPILTNYLFHDLFDLEFMVERAVFSLILIAAGLMFNKFRALSILLALLPVTLILLSYFFIPGNLDLKRAAFMGAVGIIIAAGLYHHFRAKRLRQELEGHLSSLSNPG